MTVQFEVPYLTYTGNGITTDFSFDWSSGDANDNYVRLNGELLIEGTLYELEEYTPENGGIMRFTVAPVDGDVIEVFRDTPVTQEVAYEEGKPFPAETHERQMDKDTRILQEIIEAGKGTGGNVDLSADQQPEYTDILNTGGTDARVLPWTVDGLQSGVALGEVIPFGGTLPQDTAPTTKPDGYVWWGVGQPVTAGGDPEIVMSTGALVIQSTRTAPSVPRCELQYILATGRLGYGYDETLPNEEPMWLEQLLFLNPITVPNTYVIQLERTSGIVPSGSAVDTWLDAALAAEWFITEGNFVGTLHIAPDLGGNQTPDPEKQVSRFVQMTGVQN